MLILVYIWNKKSLCKKKKLRKGTSLTLFLRIFVTKTNIFRILKHWLSNIKQRGALKATCKYIYSQKWKKFRSLEQYKLKKTQKLRLGHISSNKWKVWSIYDKIWTLKVI